MSTSPKPSRAPRKPGIRACALAFALGLGALAASGCPEQGDRVVIGISVAGFAPATELDELEVTVTASRTATGDALCAPYSETFQIGSDAERPLRFPLHIEVRPGGVYDKVLFVRVIGRLWGTVRLKTERMVSLAGGDVSLPVLLPADCLGIGTGAGQHCMSGLALPSPYGRIFDEGLYVDPSEPCLEP